MKILFTGASSFSGYWYVRYLVSRGHTVSCVFTEENESSYNGLRRKRVEMLNALSGLIPLWGCKLNSEKLISILEKESFDCFCHHAGVVSDYKSLGFDVLSAFSDSVLGMLRVFDSLKKKGCRRVVLTGTYFEADEGCGSNSEAFSPYALSKGLIWQFFRYYVPFYGMNLGKFVMPNPFGPYEDRGFTTYFAREWLRGNIPTIETPDYIRDNMPIYDLAKAYVDFVESEELGISKVNPSGYVLTQKEFGRLLASKLSTRWNMPCDIQINQNACYKEPMARSNNCKNITILYSIEYEFWDNISTFYCNNYAT